MSYWATKIDIDLLNNQLKKKAIGDKITVDLAISIIKNHIMDIEDIDPNEGDIFSIEDFVEACNDRLFIDDDGFAHPVIIVDGISKKIRNLAISPSEILVGKYREFEKVIWYNR